jgi:hypothetical protein
MEYNPHPSSINLIKDCRHYCEARKILKKYSLTKREQLIVIRLLEEALKIRLK